MADIRQDAAFATAVAGARAAISQLHLRHRIPDATALYQRGRNVNNLSGHANSIIPLAVLIAREYPALLAVIRARTSWGEQWQPARSRRGIDTCGGR